MQAPSATPMVASWLAAARARSATACTGSPAAAASWSSAQPGTDALATTFSTPGCSSSGSRSNTYYRSRRHGWQLLHSAADAGAIDGCDARVARSVSTVHANRSSDVAR